MTDYAKQLEKQIEELQQRLAKAEGFVPYWTCVNESTMLFQSDIFTYARVTLTDKSYEYGVEMYYNFKLLFAWRGEINFSLTAKSNVEAWNAAKIKTENMLFNKL